MTRALAPLLVACGGEVAVVEIPPQQLPPQPTARVQMQVATSAALMSNGEHWTGQYRCAQGMTDLDLHIDAVSGDQVDATFFFEHKPSGAAGSYKLSGTIDASGNLRLVPGIWIEQPPNYVSVGMTGVVSGNVYRGRIDNPSCGFFSVQREP